MHEGLKGYHPTPTNPNMDICSSESTRLTTIKLGQGKTMDIEEDLGGNISGLLQRKHLLIISSKHAFRV